MKDEFSPVAPQENPLNTDVKSFSPDNAIIRAGIVQLNKISQYLADLPAHATAEFLVSPQDLANIDGGGVRSWANSVERIRDIKDYHGLDGMPVFDRPETDPDVSYEKAWAAQIKAVFAQAQSTGQKVTTGLFMPTNRLVLDTRDEANENNLYASKDKIAQEGKALITASRLDGSHCQWTSTEHPGLSDYIRHVDFTNGHFGWERKVDGGRKSARPVALAINP